MNNNMIIFLAAGLVFFLIIIFLAVYTRNTVIKKALKKYIKPDLQKKGYVFVRYTWIGYFDRGDFSDDSYVFIPSVAFGYPVTSTYIDVYFSDNGTIKKITVRIDKILLWVKSISYSRAL